VAASVHTEKAQPTKAQTAPKVEKEEPKTKSIGRLSLTKEVRGTSKQNHKSVSGPKRRLRESE
jgi:hypothetical protein